MDIVDIARGNNGIVTARLAADAGIKRSRLSEAARAGRLVRVGPGIYCLPEAWEDEYALAQTRFPRGVLSHGTALFLHDMTDRTPERVTMTFPRAYNATAARAEGIEVRTCADDVLGLGAVALRDPAGNTVRAYDVERTLCDLLRGRSAVDVQVVNPAMRRYAGMRGKDVNKLLDYAGRLGVERKVRNYLEVLL